MELCNRIIVDGGLKLPLGFRFHPTDEELLVYYLKHKCFILPLPTSIILEFDVFLTTPWNLPGDSREKRYFFSNKEQDVNPNKKTFKRVVADFGYWKEKGKDKKIVTNGIDPIVGIRKTLVFYRGTYSNSTRTHSNSTQTQWNMHEFHLEGPPSSPSNIMEMSCGNWKVYKVFQKKIRPKKHGNIASQTSAIVIDFKGEEASGFDPPPPPSPYSSWVDEEEKSA